MPEKVSKRSGVTKHRRQPFEGDYVKPLHWEMAVLLLDRT